MIGGTDPQDRGQSTVAGQGAGLPQVRISNSDRERALALVQQACIDERLTLDELGQRVEWIERATTIAELWTAVGDFLPAPAPASSPPTSTVAIMSEVSRTGRWRVGERTSAIAVMGKCKLDLRHAAISAHVTIIRVSVVMGELEVLVPEGVEVELEATTVMGSRTVHGQRELPPNGAPVIRITGLALMGAVNVRVMP